MLKEIEGKNEIMKQNNISFEKQEKKLNEQIN